LADPVGDGVLAFRCAAGAGVVPQELVLAQLGDFSLYFAELGDDDLEEVVVVADQAGVRAAEQVQ
jgi:hypothetical protein